MFDKNGDMAITIEMFFEAVEEMEKKLDEEARQIEEIRNWK